MAIVAGYLVAAEGEWTTAANQGGGGGSALA